MGQLRLNASAMLSIESRLIRQLHLLTGSSTLKVIEKFAQRKNRRAAFLCNGESNPNHALTTLPPCSTKLRVTGSAVFFINIIIFILIIIILIVIVTIINTITTNIIIAITKIIIIIIIIIIFISLEACCYEGDPDPDPLDPAVVHGAIVPRVVNRLGTGNNGAVDHSWV
ncbi:unnamed protein product [Merluccius merluccius]